MVYISDCLCCEISADRRVVAGGVHKIGRHWAVNAALESKGRPWFVLQTVDHVSDLSGLRHEQSVLLGPILTSISSFLKETPGVDHTYVFYLNELQPPHVHFHITVATNNDILRGPDLLGAPLPANSLVPDSAQLIHALVAELRIHAL